MKNIYYVFLFAALSVSFSACNSTAADDAWQTANTNDYQAPTKKPDFKKLLTTTGPSGVYYKVIQSGTGTEYPFQTSNVKVLYKGCYYDGTVFDTGSSQNNIPVEFNLGSVVRGFSFALQNMVVGDKWEIWIPYYLGYGAAGYTDPNTYQLIIKGYTTLVFTVELVSITQYP
jgi:FKBP-type peptidyl-prolyl cis-trans isomerase